LGVTSALSDIRGSIEVVPGVDRSGSKRR